MAFVISAVERKIVVMHKGIRAEHLVLPIRFLILVGEINWIVLRNLRHIKIAQFIHIQPRTETILLVECDFFGAVTHRLDTNFRVGKILCTKHFHLFPAVLNAPICIKRNIHLTFATGFGRNKDDTVGTTATVDCCS